MNRNQKQRNTFCSAVKHSSLNHRLWKFFVALDPYFFTRYEYFHSLETFVNSLKQVSYAVLVAAWHPLQKLTRQLFSEHNSHIIHQIIKTTIVQRITCTKHFQQLSLVAVATEIV